MHCQEGAPSFLMRPCAHDEGMRTDELSETYNRHLRLQKGLKESFDDTDCGCTGLEHFPGADGYARREGGPQVTGQRL